MIMRVKIVLNGEKATTGYNLTIAQRALVPTISK